MWPSLPDLLVTSGVICGVAGIAAATFVFVKLSQPSKLDGIPTVGSSNWLGSWWAGLIYLTNAADILQEGYEKASLVLRTSLFFSRILSNGANGAPCWTHKSAPFKVAELHHWTVVLSSREHVGELQRAPDDTLSLSAANDDLLQAEYTMNLQIEDNLRHIPILTSRLTRNIRALYPVIRNEITTAFDDLLDLKGSEWKSILALSSVQKVVCRTSNRVFVGLPLCKDSDWIDLSIQYALNVVKGGAIIRLFPDWLKPIAAQLFTNVNQINWRGRKLLGPIIEERQKYLNEYGNGWADKPNDFLSWLMEKAEGPESTVELLTTHILVLNFAAVYSTANVFTHVLLYLAANPQYIKPLREEVEGVVDKEGWSKAALERMWKVDSFIKECQRLEGIESANTIRKALKDFTFSDGTFVPKGTTIVSAVRSIHYDETFYENARAFEPFRFAHLREEDGEGMKHQLVSTTTKYFPFGHGRHACPGRFFAASQLKSMLAHIVVTYDVKLAENTTRPPSLHIATAVIADPSAKVMFRRRVD